MTCRSCNTDNPSGVAFCIECGECLTDSRMEGIATSSDLKVTRTHFADPNSHPEILVNGQALKTNPIPPNQVINLGICAFVLAGLGNALIGKFVEYGERQYDHDMVSFFGSFVSSVGSLAFMMCAIIIGHAVLKNHPASAKGRPGVLIGLILSYLSAPILLLTLIRVFSY